MGRSHTWRTSYMNNDRDRTQNLLPSFLSSLFRSIDWLHFLSHPSRRPRRRPRLTSSQLHPHQSRWACLHRWTPHRTLTGWRWSYVDLSGQSHREDTMTGSAGSHAPHWSGLAGSTNWRPPLEPKAGEVVFPDLKELLFWWRAVCLADKMTSS